MMIATYCCELVSCSCLFKLCIQALAFPCYDISIRANFSVTYNTNIVVLDSSYWLHVGQTRLNMWPISNLVHESCERHAEMLCLNT